MDALSPAVPNESALLAGLRAGNADAFEELVRKYMPALLRVARRFLRSEDDARDAVQDAFISAFKSIRNFAGQSQLSTWLHRIVVNSSLMKLRSQKRHQEEEIDMLLPRFQEDGHQVEPSIPWSETAEALLQRAEMREMVRAAIDRLPETYRTILLLRDIEELTPEETAAALGISRNAVKVRLHRARQALRTVLDPHMRGTTA